MNSLPRGALPSGILKLEKYCPWWSYLHKYHTLITLLTYAAYIWYHIIHMLLSSIGVQWFDKNAKTCFQTDTYSVLAQWPSEVEHSENAPIRNFWNFLVRQRLHSTVFYHQFKVARFNDFHAFNFVGVNRWLLIWPILHGESWRFHNWLV